MKPDTSFMISNFLLFIAQLLTKVMSGAEGTYFSLFEFGNAVCDYHFYNSTFAYRTTFNRSYGTSQKVLIPFSNGFDEFGNAGSPQLSIEYNRFVAVESLCIVFRPHWQAAAYKAYCVYTDTHL